MYSHNIHRRVGKGGRGNEGPCRTWCRSVQKRGVGTHIYRHDRRDRLSEPPPASGGSPVDLDGVGVSGVESVSVGLHEHSEHLASTCVASVDLPLITGVCTSSHTIVFFGGEVICGFHS